MNEAYQRLRDDLPARKAPDAASFPLDPKRAKAWVDALPRANQQGTLRQLGDALESLRGLRIEGAQRIGVLEVLRPSILEGVVLLDKVLHGTTFPLPPGKAQVAEQIQGFHRELALGYRIAVVELCAPSGGVPFLKGAQVSLALERALHHGARELAASYFMYRTPPGAWSALNALFRFALQAKLDDKPVEEPAERQPLSPRQVYAQALLLALSNPYRFSQREQAELWPVTRDLAGHVEFLARRPAADAFAIPAYDDRGPGYLPDEREGESRDVLWMSIAPLREALDAPLRNETAGAVHVRFRQGHTVVAAGELLRRLRAGWDHAAARSHQRLGAGHVLDTVIGLSGLHYYLAGHLDFDTFMRQVRGVAAHDGGGVERAAWAHGSHEAGRAPVVQARVADQSLGGYRLHWGLDEGLRARVGEIVGLAIPGDDGERSWMVGVVRWLRYDPHGDVDAGVELLARRAHAVGLRSLDVRGVPKPPLRAIQIDCLRVNGEGGALHFVAPTLLDAQAARIEVARAVENEDFEQDVVPIAQCSDILVLENAGDYLLLAANPIAHA